MLRVLTAGVCLAALASRASGAAELKIGVVNIDEILARYKKAEDIGKTEDDRFRADKKKIAERSREYNKRLAQLDAKEAAANDPGKLKLERELELERFLLKRDMRDLQQQRQQGLQRIKRRITDEVVAVCARIGRAEGYDLILKRSAPGKSPADDRAQILAFQLNPVLYAAGSVDMTTRVLEVLEDAYSRGIKLVPDRPEAKEPRPEGSTRSEGQEDDPARLSAGRSAEGQAPSEVRPTFAKATADLRSLSEGCRPALTGVGDDAPAGSPGTLWQGSAGARGDGDDAAPKERPTTGEGGRG